MERVIEFACFLAGWSLGLAASVAIDGDDEEDALAVHKVGRDYVERDDPALLVALASPDRANLLGTSQNIIALVVLPGDA